MKKFSRPTNFEFGIYLDEKTRKTIKKRLQLLHEIAPSNSKIHLTMKMPFRQIKGELVIKSFGYTFTSEAKSLDPIELFDLLEMDMKRQLNQWKSKRFIPKPEMSYQYKAS